MKQPKITIIDYGVGNLLSVKRGLEHFGAEVHVTSNYRDLSKAERLVFPGVGAFPNAMAALKQLDLIEPIKEFAELGKPFMAICLGMQLLMDESDEFKLTRGLGLIDGKVTKLQIIENEDLVQKVPHIGWARINRGETFSSWESTLLQENSSGDYCYFVHSYHVQPTQKSSILATASFNGIEIVAAIQKDNIYAFQFHPEKSGEVGLKILSRFCHD